MLEDIERYLTNQPILARPPSAFYQFRKLVERHKVAFAGLAIIFALLSGFAAVMAAQSVRIANERDKAVRAEQTAEERKNEADQQRHIAEDNLKKADAERIRAEGQTALAEEAKKAEEEQRRKAEDSLREAKQLKAVAETQTSLARQQKSLADQSSIEANDQKTLAVNEAEKNRQMLYVSETNLADQAMVQADIPRVQDLLENQIPGPSQSDFRGPEWYHLWRLSHQELMTFRPTGTVLSTSFSSDGKMLAVSDALVSDIGTSSPKITLIDAATRNQVETFAEHRFLAFLPNEKLLAITENNKVGIVDIRTKKISPSKIEVSPSSIPAFSPNGNLMANLGRDGTVEIWDIATGNKMFSLKSGENIYPGNDLVPLKGPDKSIPSSLLSMFSSPIRFSADGKVLALASNFSSVKLWDLATGRELPGLESDGMDFFSLAFSPDGKIMASQAIGEEKPIKLWDLKTKSVIAVLKGQGQPNLGTGSPLAWSWSTLCGFLARRKDFSDNQWSRGEILGRRRRTGNGYDPKGHGAVVQHFFHFLPTVKT